MNNNSHSQVNNSHSTFYKADRFAKLSEKLSQIQNPSNFETITTSKYMNIDNKINEVENKLGDQIDSLDRKYNALKDQLTNLTKLYEEEKFNKENSGNKKTKEELKNFEVRVKNMLMEERQNMQNLTDIVYKKIEAQIGKIESEGKKENEILMKSVETLKQTFEVGRNIHNHI